MVRSVQEGDSAVVARLAKPRKDAKMRDELWTTHFRKASTSHERVWKDRLEDSGHQMRDRRSKSVDDQIQRLSKGQEGVGIRKD